jgi:WD40 repeat protein
VGHTAYVAAVAFSPEGKVLASGSEDRTVKLWDWQSGGLLRTLAGHPYSVNSVACSPAGTRLACGSGQSFEVGEVRLWDCQTGEMERVLVEGCNRVDLVLFSPDGKQIGVVTGSGSGPREPIVPEARLLDAKTGKVLWTVTGVNWIAFSPDGKAVAGGRPDSAIGLYGVRTGKLRRCLPAGPGNVLAVAIASDGEKLASGSLESEQGRSYGAVKIWDMRLGAVQRNLKAHRDAATFVTFSPAGGVLASGGLDDTVKLWNVRTGELKRTLEIAVPKWSGVLQCAFSPDGKTLASGSQDGTIRLWDVSGLT